MSMQPTDVQGQFALFTKKWWQYATATSELTTIATALNSDTTTHDRTIEVPPLAVKVDISHTAFTNLALHIVNMAKAGNVPNAVIADEIDAAIGVAYPPGNVTVPFVSGTGTVGQTLACTTGTWVGSPTSYTYQWTRDGTNIAAATAATYVLVAADSTHQIACVVTATNATGSTTAPPSNAIHCA